MASKRSHALAQASAAGLSGPQANALMVPAAKRKFQLAWNPLEPRKMPAAQVNGFIDTCLNKVLNEQGKVKVVLPAVIYRNLAAWLCFLRSEEHAGVMNLDSEILSDLADDIAAAKTKPTKPDILSESVAVILAAAFDYRARPEEVVRDDALSKALQNDQGMDIAGAFQSFISQQASKYPFVQKSARGNTVFCPCGELMAFQRGNRQWNSADFYKCAKNTCKVRFEYEGVLGIVESLKALGVTRLPELRCEKHPNDPITFKFIVKDDNQTPEARLQCSHRKNPKDDNDAFCNISLEILDPDPEALGAMAPYKVALLNLIHDCLPQ